MTKNGFAQDLHFAQVLRAAEALTQLRPLIASITTFVVSAIVMALGGSMAVKAGFNGAKFVLGTAGVVNFAVLAVGLTAVGVLLMDRAKEIEPRSIVDAFVYGLISLPKFIGFALILLALTLAVGAIGGVVYFICKVPGMGPVILFVAHPLLVAGVAAALAAVLWIAVPLFAPAVWDGLSFMEALSVLLAVARQRLVPVVATYLLLYVVIGVIASLIFSALVPSYLSMTGMAAAVLGPDVSRVESLLELAQSLHLSLMGGESGAGNGHFYAMLLASGLIFGVVAALLGQVLIMGMNLVYLVAVDGLDVAASQSAIQEQLAQVKEKARDAQARAQQAAERARTPRSAPATAIIASCPQCKAPVAAGDPFCSGCGHRLRP